MKMMIGSAIAIALMGSAFAGGVGDGRPYNNEIPVVQSDLAPVVANIALYAEWVQGDLRAAATAIGNNATLASEGSTYFYLEQYQGYRIDSFVDANLVGVGGNVEINSTAVCNNGSLSTENSHAVLAYTIQRCTTLDPSATINGQLVGIGGDATLAATAIANNLTMDVETTGLQGGFGQINTSPVVVNVNAAFSDVGGNVAVAATAVGNNISITQRQNTP